MKSETNFDKCKNDWSIFPTFPSSLVPFSPQTVAEANIKSKAKFMMEITPEFYLEYYEWFLAQETFFSSLNKIKFPSQTSSYNQLLHLPMFTTLSLLTTSLFGKPPVSCREQRNPLKDTKT